MYLWFSRALLVVVGICASTCLGQGNVEGNNVVAALEEEKEEFQETAENDFDREQIMSELAVPIFGDITEMDIISAILSFFQQSNSSEVEEATVLPTSGAVGDPVPLPSEACVKDAEKFVEDLMDSKPYALRMRTAYASIPYLTGIAFTYRLKYDGIYELCDGIKAANNGTPFDGQFCQLYIPVENSYPLSLGVCTPASCSNLDLYLLINNGLAMVGIEAGVYFTCIRDVPWTGDAIFVLFLLCLFVACVLIGTSYDVFYRKPKLLKATSEEKDKHHRLREIEERNIDEVQRLNREDAENEAKDGNAGVGATSAEEGAVKKDDEAPEEETSQAPKPSERRRKGALAGILDAILMSFSCVNNGSKVLSCEKTAGNLNALNGIRVLSMFWIIWGHTNLFLLFGRLDNPFDVLENVLGKFWFRITTEGTFAVDTFFVLSGLLLTFLTLKHLSKSEGKLNWFLFYFHRFWRITPLYMICIGIWSSLLFHIGTGPDKKEFLDGARSQCADYWWSNLLYINNLVPYPGSVNLCLGWSWYLANDMQFFVISPIFLYLLFRPKWRKIGIGSVIGVAMMSCLITAIVAGYWGYPVGNYPVPFNNRTATQPSDADRIYAKPWCRIQSYMVGIFVGYLLYSFKDQKIKIPLALNLLGWILSLGIMFVLIFSMYWSSDTDPLPNWFAALWLGFNRFLFSACVGWVSFACLTGNGGPVDSFLSWGFWQPLSRLTFGAYLLHPMVIFLFILNDKTSFHWTVLETGYFFIANVVVSYGWAFLLSLLVEGPTMGIEKAFLKRLK